MIDWLPELNRAVLAVGELMDERREATLEGVLTQCRSVVIESRLPDHGATLAFAQRLGLLALEGTLVRLSEAGQAFLGLNPERLYDLTPDQRALMIRTCYLGGALQRETHDLFRAFAPSYEHGSFRWSEYDSPPLPGEGWIVEHLVQVGLLRRSPGLLVVAPEFSEAVDTFRSAPKGWSEESLRAYLKEKEELGVLGEELALAYEARRLQETGCDLESHCIRRVSSVRVNAGFDIESFDGRSRGLQYDRFIEVKGSRDPRLKFFWSTNEVEIATKLGPRYWIYFQGGIDTKTRTARNEVLTFQDPVRSVLEDGQFTKTPQGFIVTGGMRGAAVAAR